MPREGLGFMPTRCREKERERDERERENGEGGREES
jgi:hypothetical protein